MPAPPPCPVGAHPGTGARGAAQAASSTYPRNNLARPRQACGAAMRRLSPRIGRSEVVLLVAEAEGSRTALQSTSKADLALCARAHARAFDAGGDGHAVVTDVMRWTHGTLHHVG